MSAVLREVRVPDLGDGVDAGTVIAVRVSCGETVANEQTLLELETDKVTLEIPAPCAGVVRELRCAENDVLSPGAIVIVLEHASTDLPLQPTIAPAVVAAVETSSVPPADDATVAISADLPAPTPSSLASALPAGPAARREARQLGVSIAAVSGTGARGRITREDVRAHVRALNSAPAASPAAELPALPDASAHGPIRRERLTPVESAIARNMARAASVVAQAWVGRQIDVTELERARRAYRSRQTPGEAPLTLTAILCKAVALGLAAFPRFNAAFDHHTGELVYREYCHIGIAVDTPRGLLVPVLRDAGTLSVRDLARQLQALSDAARADDLPAASRRGAGFTLSNLGGLGVDALQPMVNWPEVAILGVAACSAHLVKTASGIEERLLLPVTLGFDHRVIDGANGARFLECLSGLLTEPMRLLVEA